MNPMSQWAIIAVLGAVVATVLTPNARGADVTPNPAPAAPNFTIFMIGDSTMANKPVVPGHPERGWGQLLPLYFKDGVRIENHAMNGRSTKSFRAEGRWKTVSERFKPGDYLIIQFGHNDEKTDKPAVYAAPFGDFKTNLARYVQEAREKGAVPVLATPVNRRRFDAQGNFQDTHGDYPKAVREVAADQKVPLLEMHGQTEALLRKIGPETSKKLFLWIEPGEFATLPAGLRDDTHFSAYGANVMCDLALDEMKSSVPALIEWLKK